MDFEEEEEEEDFEPLNVWYILFVLILHCSSVLICA